MSKFIRGEYNVRCDRCQSIFKSSQTIVDRRPFSLSYGQRLCLEDYDVFAPQLKPIRHIPDDPKAVKNPRVEPTTEVDPTQVGMTWDMINFVTWENWHTPWGQIIGGSGESPFTEDVIGTAYTPSNSLE